MKPSGRPRRASAVVLAAVAGVALLLSGAPQPAGGATSAKKTVTTRRPTTTRRAAARTTRPPARPARPASTVRATPPPTTAFLPPTISPSTVSPPTLPTPTPTLPAPVAGPAVSLPPNQADPAAYLETVLTLVQQYSVRKRSVDIAALATRARSAIAGAVTTADTYPAIRELLAGLGDRHSSLQAPAQAASLLRGESTGFGVALYPGGVVFVLPGSPAEVAGVRDRDVVVRVNGRDGASITAEDRAADTLRLTLRRAAVLDPVEVAVARGPLDTSQVPVVRPLGGGVGYVELQGALGDTAKLARYVDGALAGMRAADAPPACGWVVDLRRNSGGWAFAALAAVAPLLGDGPVGGDVDGNGRTRLWAVDGPRVLAGGAVAWSATTPFQPRLAGAPVALLLGPGTASAAEATVIAFQGRGSVRSFGEPTVGVTSFNTGITLRDGALLQITSSYDVDRTGRQYDGPLEPDERVTTDWATYGTELDPVLGAGSGWVRSQPSCLASG